MPRQAWCDEFRFTGECGACRPCRHRQSTRDSRERKAGRFVPLRPLGRPIEPCDDEGVARQRRDWRIDRQDRKQRRKVVRGSASPRRFTTTLTASAVEVRSAGRMGRGLFAVCASKTGDHLCVYEGRYYGECNGSVLANYMC